MKRVFLSLFLVSIMFFCACGFNDKTEYLIESAKIQMLGVRTIEVNNIETRMVMWKSKFSTVRNNESFNGLQKTNIWLLYPVEKITDDLEGKTVGMTYFITRLKKPPIVYVTDIQVLN